MSVVKRFIHFTGVVLASTMLVLSAGACQDPNDVRIRIRNASDRDFDEVYVVAGGQPVTNGVYYGSVDAGDVSEFRAFASAYSYAYVRVTHGGQEYAFVPIDYVGETPLSAGNYTYVLGFSKSVPPQLTVSCLKD